MASQGPGCFMMVFSGQRWGWEGWDGGLLSLLKGLSLQWCYSGLSDAFGWEEQGFLSSSGK